MTEAPLTKLGALGMLSAEALATLRAAGEVEDVAVDTTLCRSGDPCAEVWVVLGGALSVQWLDEETNER